MEYDYLYNYYNSTGDRFDFKNNSQVILSNQYNQWVSFASFITDVHNYDLWSTSPCSIFDFLLNLLPFLDPSSVLFEP